MRQNVVNVNAISSNSCLSWAKSFILGNGSYVNRKCTVNCNYGYQLILKNKTECIKGNDKLVIPTRSWKK